MATIKQIAERANVSQSTVSRVLNQDETLAVSAEVRNLIFKIAHELNYVPPKMRHTQRGNHIVIGVADWHIVRKDRPDMRLETLESNSGILSQNLDVDFERICYGQEKQVDGIIAFGSFSEEEMNFLRRQAYAILFVNSNQKDYEFDQIVMDYSQGLQDMVHYLLEEKEYHSIGYIGGIYQDELASIGTHRLENLHEILVDSDVYQERYFRVGEISRESGYTLAKGMLESGDVPEVLVLGNDEVAEGAMEALKEEKYRIPKDIAVVIYRDIDTLETQYPNCTSLRMLPDLVWTTAAKLLLERIVNQREDNIKVYLPARLEIGDST